VLSPSRPGEVTAQLPIAPPERPESLETILADFENVILPGLTHWNQPGFLAYFSSSASVPGILGEWLSAGLNVNAMLWRTSPAATELENVTLDWLRQMLGLPAGFHGVITDGASMSSPLALAVARERLGLDIRNQGMAGRSELPRLRLYISAETHSSVEKGAIVVGIGRQGVRAVPVDQEFRMDVTALARAIEEDLAAGWRPFAVVATVGTTATTSIDPVPEIAAICQKHDLWLHVDGAYGGMAAVAPEMRHILAGVEQADSLVVNPHKWLFLPVDCSAFYVRDPHLLRRTFSLVPDYLQTSEEVTNYMDWGVQLGRRFRALKLWWVIRAFGHEGLAARLREHLRLGQLLANWVDADPDFERLAPTPLSTVCFRACPGDVAARLTQAGPEEAAGLEAYLDRLNEALIEAANATGEIYLSGTRLHGRYTIRLAINNVRTNEATVARAWELLREAAGRLHA
ncbi:MAG: aminotransferase class I/II-fold pyridoxal phosphate-dependent enzyme, partial [Chloroflexi bacterium]|nr:aminotransferase class I/II-fold pyridoxal phosphate-dependent enzyme [Chloroflexota bacterium]